MAATSVITVEDILARGPLSPSDIVQLLHCIHETPSGWLWVFDSDKRHYVLREGSLPEDVTYESYRMSYELVGRYGTTPIPMDEIVEILDEMDYQTDTVWGRNGDSYDLYEESDILELFDLDCESKKINENDDGLTYTFETGDGGELVFKCYYDTVKPLGDHDAAFSLWAWSAMFGRPNK